MLLPQLVSFSNVLDYAIFDFLVMIVAKKVNVIYVNSKEIVIF